MGLGKSVPPLPHNGGYVLKMQIDSLFSKRYPARKLNNVRKQWKLKVSPKCWLCKWSITFLRKFLYEIRQMHSLCASVLEGTSPTTVLNNSINYKETLTDWNGYEDTVPWLYLLPASFWFLHQNTIVSKTSDFKHTMDVEYECTSLCLLFIW